jgi:hypothetical protein
MSTKGWTLPLAAVALFIVTLPLAAQEGRQNPPEVAAIPDVPVNGDHANAVQSSGGAAPARDYRTLWADPAIKDFTGLSENAWDFAKPDSIPGFGSSPHNHSAR